MNRARPALQRSALVAVVLAWALAVVAAGCWVPQLHHHSAHPRHALAGPVGGEYVVQANHAHLTDHTTPTCPDQSAIAVLPRSAAAPIDAAALPAVTDLVGLRAYLVVPAGRGPPAWQRSSSTGKDRLTRFCLARR